MDKELENELKEITTKVDAMATLVEKGIANADGVAEVQTEVGKLQAKLTTHEKWVSEVQRSLDKARYQGGDSYGFNADALLAAIPDRYKGMIDAFARRGKRFNVTHHDSKKQSELPNDPVVLGAIESWMKNVARLSMNEYAGDQGQLREETAKLELAMGCQPERMAQLKAAYAEGAGATGGFTVPSPLEAMVLRVAEDASIVRSMATVMTMTAFKHFIPSDTSSIVVAVVAEAGTIGQSETTFAQKTIEAKMIAVRGIAAIQVVQDSSIGLLDYWLERASEAYGLFEDKEALEGDTTDFTGLSDDAGVNEILQDIATVETNGGPITYERLAQVPYEATKRSTRVNAVWVCHPAVLRNMVAKVDSNGAPLLNRQDIARALSPNLTGVGLGEGTVLGHPLWTSDQISIARTKGTLTEASNIYFGPMQQGILLGDLLGMQFAVSEHVLWNSAQLSMRLLKRTGIIVQRPEAMTRLINVDSNPA